MRKTIKFKEPISFEKIRKAVKKVLDEYLYNCDMDDFSRGLWNRHINEFYRDSMFTKLRPDLKGFIRNCKFGLWRDYYSSDLGTRDFVLLDTGIPGRVLLCDDDLYSPHPYHKFSRDDVFTGIQYFISESYDFDDEERKEWVGRIEGIVNFILKELNQD